MNLREFYIGALLVATWLFIHGSAQAQLDKFGIRGGLNGGGFGAVAKTTFITASAELVPASADHPALLVITAKIDQGYKTYAITQPPGGPVTTKIKVDKSTAYSVGEFQSVEQPKMYAEPVFDNAMVHEHKGSVTWFAPLYLQPNVALESLEIKGSVFAQICDANNCFPPKDHTFVAVLGTGQVALPQSALAALPKNALTPSLDGRAGTTENSLPAFPDLDSTTLKAEPSQIPPGLDGVALPTGNDAPSLDYDLQLLSPENSSTAGSFPLMIGAALLAGFILNFMPCVLPVIGLKMLSFIEQSGGKSRQILLLNWWYSLGIISVFWILAGIAIFLKYSTGEAFGWGQQYRYDSFNIILICIVFVMALSFLGVWEIPIPGFASSKNAQDMARKEGAVGAFIKGMITTLLATPCSGPFLGTAVGFALVSPAPITLAIFTAMGIGMSAPYILVGLRPEVMKVLPKPGPWMDTFKQLMGFVLLGTVLWLMQPVDPPLLMPTLVMLGGLAFACWWIGRTPGYAELEAKLKSWVGGIGIAAVTAWLAFATPQITDPLPWKKFSMADFVGDVNSNKTVMVEFTAKWCATCKTLKAANLDRSKTKQSVAENNVVVYEVDIDHISDQEREFFTKIQPSQGVPLVAIFPAGKKYSPISFGDGYTQSQILEALKQAGPSKTNR